MLAENGVDGKNYDFLALSKVADQLFINDFDQRKQSYDDRCIAGANSNYYMMMGGILGMFLYFSRLSASKCQLYKVITNFSISEFIFEHG